MGKEINMANTRKDFRDTIEKRITFISIPNKISKRIGDKKKKERPSNI
jgi:hypothetical protein